jgi:ABC-type lipoprotein export system ATPase subunit
MTPIPKNEKGLALIMMGIPGSGKSTFVMLQLSFARRINNGYAANPRKRTEAASGLHGRF